jgi:hypothetical protein
MLKFSLDIQDIVIRRRQDEKIEKGSNTLPNPQMMIDGTDG